MKENRFTLKLLEDTVLGNLRFPTRNRATLESTCRAMQMAAEAMQSNGWYETPTLSKNLVDSTGQNFGKMLCRNVVNLIIAYPS